MLTDLMATGADFLGEAHLSRDDKNLTSERPPKAYLSRYSLND